MKEVLEGDQFSNEVRTDEMEAQMLGVRGVPFFVINRKYAISGAQPTEVFTNGLQKAWEEEHLSTKFQPLGSEEAANCTADGCELPDKTKYKQEGLSPKNKAIVYF